MRCYVPISFLVLTFAVPACSRPEAAASSAWKPEPKPRQDGVVQIQEASRQFIAVEAVGAGEGSGVIKAPARVAFRDGGRSQLGSPLAGRVVQVHAKPGDAVRAGDPLVTLDCPEAAAARTAYSTAEARFREARTALERARRMLDQGVGTERETIEAETRFFEAQAELARAQADVGFVGAGAGTTVILRAPIAGTVLGCNATVGAAVQPGETVVEVGDLSALWVVADVFDRDLPVVREGATATIELTSVHEPIAGRVTSVGAVVATGMRTAPVRIALDTDHAALRPGMFGRVAIEAPETRITLPPEAVLIKGKDSVVYVEKGPMTFERRPVVVTQPFDGKVQVVSGVAPGDRVVVRGALLLDGAADQLL